MLQHPHRRPAHRRHQGAGGGAEGRRAAADRAARPLRPRRRSTAAIGEIRRARRAAACAPTSRAIPDGVYRSEAFVDSDGVVNEPLRIALAVTKAGDTLHFDFSGSSPPCRGPMNSVVATTYSAVYLADAPHLPRHAAQRRRLRAADASSGPEGTFLDARYPRPVSGCAAEVSQRIAEAVFLALVQAIPDKVTAAPAGSSGNFALGGFDPAQGRRLRDVPDLRRRLRRQRRPRRPHQRLLHHRHLQDRAGRGDGAVLSRCCSAASPCARARAAPGAQRGGFGVHYEVELLRGEARASFVMDHGRFGPPGVLGGGDGAPNVVRIHRGGETFIPEHLSKDQDIALQRRRPRRGDDAGRRRLRRSVRARPGAGRARRAAGLLHARGGSARRCLRRGASTRGDGAAIDAGRTTASAYARRR